jgi:hypothetical protein
MNVKISGKCIPTDFFVIDTYHSNHDHIILGTPFLKLIDAVFDAGKGNVTIEDQVWFEDRWMVTSLCDE